MARRWSDPTAFRADPGAALSGRPSRMQSVSLLAVLVLVAGSIAALSYLVRPDRARAFDLLHGNVFIGDQLGPVSMDLASGRATFQIIDADAQVGVSRPGALSVIPLEQGTLLLNSVTGEFNMVDATGFVVRRSGGVTIGGQSTRTSAVGIASGQNAYIVRTGSSGTDVLLVSQATVALAADATNVRPRAAYRTTALGSTAPGGAASANGSLWALFTAGGATRLEQLSLPASSSTGVALARTDHGSVGRVAAVESATVDAAGQGEDVVGVATPGRVRVFAPGRAPRTVTFPAPAGVDQILPVSNAEGRLEYLLHGSAGWSYVSVGTTGGRTGPISLGTVDPSAQLAPPAASLGSIYTMQRNGAVGGVYRIDAAGKVTAVAAAYPQKTQAGHSIESAGFADGYLTAQDSRVFVDSPGHYLALTIFTDGSHPPLVVAKINLTTVNAANGPDTLTRGSSTDNTKTPPKKPTSSPPKQTGAPRVSNQIDCKQTVQKPHKPVINGVAPTPRTVAISWDYQLVSSQDCKPTTYQLTFTVISPDAPSGPGQVEVDAHTDVVVSGLFPNTQYRVTVTAAIKNQRTASLPVTFTTAKEGPAAPTDLAVTTDATGNWTVSWSGCGTVAQGCVPADTWTVIPSFCDGQQSASPAPVSVQADPTSVKQQPYVLKGGDALLGRGLQFRVQGSGADGQLGVPTAASRCVYSFGAPNAAAMTLTATKPATTTLGGSTTTTVSLDLGADPIRTVGGVGSTVALTLSGNGATQTKSFKVAAAQRALSATFTGLRAGAAYTATAVVTTAHGNLSAQKTAPAVTPSSAWPPSDDQGGHFGIAATCPPLGSLSLSCRLTVTFHGLSSAEAGGERFDVSSGVIVCGSTSTSLSLDDFDPATAQITKDLSQLNLFYGTCTVRIVLVEAQVAGHTPYFGGVPSPVLTRDVDLGSAQSVGGGNSDFAASWSGSSASIYYTGGNALIGALSRGWRETLLHGNATGVVCGTRGPDDAAPTANSPHTIPVDQGCINRYGGDASVWTVVVTWQNTIGGGSNTESVTLNGPVPTYKQCTPAAGDFTALWGSTPQVTVSYGGGQAKISGCPGQSWTFTLLDQNNAQCGQPGSSTGASDPGYSVTITPSCGTTPADGWSVRLSYTDPSGAAQQPFTFPVTNDPPS